MDDSGLNDHWDFSISPNPSSGLIELSSSDIDMEGAEISLFDVAGRLLIHQKIEGIGIPKLDLRSFQRGVFVLRLRKGEIEHVRKVVLQ